MSENNKSSYIFNEYVYIALQLTWGLLQTIVGGLVYLKNKGNKHYIFRGAVVTEWDRQDGLSMGMFVFVPHSTGEVSHLKLLMHEYGHTIQSLYLGPVYLLAIGIPSIVWNQLPAFDRLRETKGYDYYDFYTEKWADTLGKVVRK